MRLNTETTVGIFVLAAFGVFFYMTFQIGVFRLDSTNYRAHKVFFVDVSGLSRKADVKIAGVKCVCCVAEMMTKLIKLTAIF